MTDFTKEELEFLANELGVWGNDYEGCHEESEKLLKKIQLMIDNYCVHESDGKSYCPGLYDKICDGSEINNADLNRVNKCIKCNKYYE